MAFKKILFVIEIVTICFLYTSSFFIQTDFRLSFYSAFLFLYFVTQTITARLNHNKMKNIPAPPWKSDTVDDNPDFTNIDLDLKTPEHLVVLLIVGHRENPVYWDMCLRSVLNIQTENLRAIYIMIDGNEAQDQPMYTSASALFSDPPPGFPPVHIHAVDKRGKRGMLYMGIERIRFDFHDIQNEINIAVTDSDTVLQPQSLVELEKCLLSDPRNGCATGLLDIYNVQDGLLPKIINARYYYAFAIERASLSYFGCMTCCSGPLSIYKLSTLPPTIMERFRTQTFLGHTCEPGDDRHLTNLILLQGYTSRQTSLAIASTEAPETMMRFLLQQLRWSRSFYRELYWQIKSLDKQSFYLGLVTVYETLFPYFILTWILILFFKRHEEILYIKAVILSFGIIFLRTLLMYIFSKGDRHIWYNLLYYFLYFLFLLPTKIYAGVTITNNTWVTQSRDTKKISFSRDAICYITWIGLYQAMLVTGIFNVVYFFLM